MGWGDMENNKITWVRWKDICCSKECGGIGVKNIVEFNEALLCGRSTSSIAYRWKSIDDLFW